MPKTLTPKRAKKRAPKRERIYPKLSRADFHLYIHRGLRKGCDSTSSSLMWNLAYVSDKLPELDKAWNDAFDILYARYNKCPVEFFQDIHHEHLILNELDFGTCEKGLVRCAFCLLTKDDWQGLSYFFKSPF